MTTQKTRQRRRTMDDVIGIFDTSQEFEITREYSAPSNDGAYSRRVLRANIAVPALSQKICAVILQDGEVEVIYTDARQAFAADHARNYFLKNGITPKETIDADARARIEQQRDLLNEILRRAH